MSIGLEDSDRAEVPTGTDATATAPLLSIENLSIGFNTEGGHVRVVDDVSFAVPRGHTIGLVGESGCGKSVTAMSILRLLEMPPARIERGSRVMFDGTDLLRLSASQMRRMRGNRIGMIFQEPMTSLNPVYTVGAQISEALRLHRDISRGEALQQAEALLHQVGIGAAQRRLRQYPHELSGGLRQRVMIAIAIACGPDLLIADEPTTALDVTIQAQIMELLADLSTEQSMSMLLITHDLGLVARFCDEVVVMYAGRVVEQCAVETLFAAPRHPYTRGLLASIPRPDASGDVLPSIPGMVPSPGDRGAGCHFYERCSRRQDRCRTERPPLARLDEGTAHPVACWNPAT